MALTTGHMAVCSHVNKIGQYDSQMQTKEAAKYTAKHNYWSITSETEKKINNISPISAKGIP